VLYNIDLEILCTTFLSDYTLNMDINSLLNPETSSENPSGERGSDGTGDSNSANNNNPGPGDNNSGPGGESSETDELLERIRRQIPTTP
jgi:hypothetical protein